MEIINAEGIADTTRIATYCMDNRNLTYKLHARNAYEALSDVGDDALRIRDALRPIVGDTSTLDGLPF